MPLFEIRQYRVKDGRMEEWIDFMESRIVPFITSRGMVVNAMFEGEEEKDLFIWIRQFDNEAHRDELYKAVYETEEWQSEFKPVVRSMVDVGKAIVHRVTATQSSPIK